MVYTFGLVLKAVVFCICCYIFVDINVLICVRLIRASLCSLVSGEWRSADNKHLCPPSGVEVSCAVKYEEIFSIVLLLIFSLC